MRYFSWDRNKAEANLKDHKISFETARHVLDDPYFVQDYDWNPGGEDRWHTIGLVHGTLLVLVVHTTHESNGDEYVRIISARRAERNEREKYFSRNRDAGCFCI